MSKNKHETSQLLLLLILSMLTGVSTSEAGTVPRSEEVLPLAEMVRAQLPLADASPSELLAGAEAQMGFFFPAGPATPVATRTQLDALIASTLLLEEGLRRGSGYFRQARSLFDCYVIMFATGHSGALARMFESLERQAAGTTGEERELLSLYRQSLEQFEAHGRASARSLGEVLLNVSPDETEIAYMLAGIAEQSGELEEAARLYELGVDSEMYSHHLVVLAELQGAAEDSDSAVTMDAAVELEPDLDQQRDDLESRIEDRLRVQALEARQDRDRASESELFELAGLYRKGGAIAEALAIFEGLRDWDDAPPEFAEQFALMAMDANLPLLMHEVLSTTRERSEQSANLLQLRIVAESVLLVAAASRGGAEFGLEAYLASDEGQTMADDLSRFEEVDPPSALFVRVYLELVSALIELRMSGSLDEDRVEELHEQVDELIEAAPDRVGGHRFHLMLAIYTEDSEALSDALDGYRRFCNSNDCDREYRRAATTVQMQVAVNDGETDLLDEVDEMVDDWPRSERGSNYYLTRGTSALLRARIDGGSSSRQERLFEQATEALVAGVRYQPATDGDDDARASDYAALYNNLAFIALEQRDIPAARLYLGAARNYSPNNPAIMLNLGVSQALGLELAESLINFSLGAQDAGTDPALAFQLLRWVGHIYNLSDRTQEAAEAYRRALILYDTREDWTEQLDDGVVAGGSVEWGLLFDDDDGLVVTMGLASPPMFFVPAPVSIMEMAGTQED